MTDIKELDEVKTLDAEINSLVHGTVIYSPKVLQNYFWRAVDAIQNYFREEYAQQQLTPSSGKYSWGKVKDDVFVVWHTEWDIKTLIAQTDNAEKAHFLATAANQYQEPAQRAAPSDKMMIDFAEWLGDQNFEYDNGMWFTPDLIRDGQNNYKYELTDPIPTNELLETYKKIKPERAAQTDVATDDDWITPKTMSNEIVKTHIENDLVNKIPHLIFTDNQGKEWVLEHDGKLVLKEKSWYFNDKNNNANKG